MTRLAIIFLLLFATPAIAADRILQCNKNFNRPSVADVFKYQSRLMGDKCLLRAAGTWMDLEGWTAKDWVCSSSENESFIDFVSQYHYFYSAIKDDYDTKPCRILPPPPEFDS